MREENVSDLTEVVIVGVAVFGHAQTRVEGEDAPGTEESSLQHQRLDTPEEAEPFPICLYFLGHITAFEV